MTTEEEKMREKVIAIMVTFDLAFPEHATWEGIVNVVRRRTQAELDKRFKGTVKGHVRSHVRSTP